MLWPIVYLLFQSTRKILRRVFESITLPLANSGSESDRPIGRELDNHLFEHPIKTITQKGNAHLGSGQFDAAIECYESLRELGETSAAESAVPMTT